VQVGAEKVTGVTADIVKHIKDIYGIEALAHLTCGGMSTNDTNLIVQDFKQKGIENILALRGDEVLENGDYRYAKDLIVGLKPHGFGLGAACYPEGHISCETLDEDMQHVKQKQDAGANFLITQLFFENDVFYRFLDKARAAGVTVPVSAGIMPMLSRAQIERMIFMCGVSLPAPIIKLINKYGDQGESLVQAGVEYACKQMQDLCDQGVQGIHLYTMNKPAIAEYCMRHLTIKRVSA